VTPVLLDTGVIVALLDRSEQYHRACREALQQIQAPLVTCESVITEACYLLRGLAGAADAVLANVEREVFRIPFALGESCPGVRALMRKYARVPMDLADACLVRLAEETGTGRLLTLDSDFSIYRWRKNRPFDLLIELDQ
jgi:predicted nucleic acid-binding protein